MPTESNLSKLQQWSSLLLHLLQSSHLRMQPQVSWLLFHDLPYILLPVCVLDPLFNKSILQNSLPVFIFPWKPPSPNALQQILYFSPPSVVWIRDDQCRRESEKCLSGYPQSYQVVKTQLWEEISVVDSLYCFKTMGRRWRGSLHLCNIKVDREWGWQPKS